MPNSRAVSPPLTTGSPVGAGAATWVARLNSGEQHPPAPEPQHGLFDVEVYGLREFALVPRNDLARDLAGAWLHGRLKTVLHMQGVRAPTPAAEDCWKARDNVTRLAIRLEVPPLLTSGGDPFYTGLEITAEERTIAMAAIVAHRESKRPSSRKRSRK